jgi:hypothetical protein
MHICCNGERTPVAVEVVSLAVMCSYGPVRLLLVPLNETCSECSPQTILVLCPYVTVQCVQFSWTGSN